MKRHFFLPAAALLLLIGLTRGAAGTRAAPALATDAVLGGSWSWPEGMRLDSQARSIVFAGSTLVVGGYFYQASGDPQCTYIAFRAGPAWDCPPGLNIGSAPDSMVWDGTNLWIAGNFDYAGPDYDCVHVARWTGTAWDCPPAMPLGTAQGEQVFAIAWDGTYIWAGGQFENASGDAECDYIARWDGSTWNCPPGFGVYGAVYALYWDGSSMWVGGNFYNVGNDQDCDLIARWTGSAWAACPTGMSMGGGEVRDIVKDGSILYAGGSFNAAGGDGDCKNVGRWTGSAWNCPTGMAVSSQVFALAWGDSRLWVGGLFTNAGGNTNCANIAVWTGSAYECPGPLSYNPHAILIDGNEVYVAGNFADGGGDQDCDNICLYTLPTPVLFEDGFESGDFSAWSGYNDGDGDMTVSGACALEGSNGLCLPSTNNKRKQMIDQTPADESLYYASFMLDPNGIDISGAADRVRIYQSRNDATFPFILLLRDNASLGSYQVRLRLQNDDATFTDSAWITVSDAPHTIGVEWRRDSSQGGSDGFGKLYLDNTLVATVSAVDNVLMRVEGIRLGLTSRMDGIVFTGTLYMDDFYSDNDGYPE